MVRTFAFVFARGGSKGLPGKNIRPLLGKPLLAYSIELAKSMAMFERVFVSTDDDAIAAVARAYGAEVIDRPTELAADHSPEILAWRHAIEWVEDRYGAFERFVSLPATAPLRIALDVENALDALATRQADICLSMTPAQRSPFFNMVKITGQGLVELACNAERTVVRRQDAPQLFDLTTVVYATFCPYVMTCTSLLAGRVTAIEVPKERAVDIDDWVDFQLAETLMASRERQDA